MYLELYTLRDLFSIEISSTLCISIGVYSIVYKVYSSKSSKIMHYYLQILSILFIELANNIRIIQYGIKFSFPKQKRCLLIIQKNFSLVVLILSPHKVLHLQILYSRKKGMKQQKRGMALSVASYVQKTIFFQII